MALRNRNPLFTVLRGRRRRFDAEETAELFRSVDESRVRQLAAVLGKYINVNLPAVLERRDGLSDYRANPYVLMTSASVMDLSDPEVFGRFLFNSKLYMALETSFGKSVEAAFVSPYPVKAENNWTEAPEKALESAELEGLNREERARRRNNSVWREIDKSCVVGNRRFLTSIKSGPNTINDTQVTAMTDAIANNYETWIEQSRITYPSIDSLDIVLGLTYGTDKTTNNKDNQILAKLLDRDFIEENRGQFPGVLIDETTKSVRVYRRIGIDFWAFIGQPDNPSAAQFIFLEILLALARALADGIENAEIEDRINHKIGQLARALAHLRFPQRTLPERVRGDFTENQLFWFATAMTSFYDDGV